MCAIGTDCEHGTNFPKFTYNLDANHAHGIGIKVI